MASRNSPEKLGRSGVAGGHCMVVRTESLRTPIGTLSRRGYFFHRPVIDELLSPVIGEALRFRSPLAACSASMSSCLRSASRLALAAESFAAAALSAHLLASCRRCSERVLILQVADYFAATALPGGVWGGRAAHSPRTQTTPGYRVGCSYLLSRACCDAQQPPFEDGGHVASGCRASRWLPQLVPASHSKWMGPAHIGPA